jgi:hypothetical protein
VHGVAAISFAHGFYAALLVAGSLAFAIALAIWLPAGSRLDAKSDI